MGYSQEIITKVKNKRQKVLKMIINKGVAEVEPIIEQAGCEQSPTNHSSKENFTSSINSFNRVVKAIRPV